MEKENSLSHVNRAVTSHCHLVFAVQLLSLNANIDYSFKIVPKFNLFALHVFI